MPDVDQTPEQQPLFFESVESMTVTAFQQANQLLREGKLEEAVVAYQKAIARNPQFYAAYQNLGETLEKLGRLDEAVEMCRKAIELKPEAGWLHQELGFLLDKQGTKKQELQDDDLLLSKMQKVVHSGLPEFGYELISVLPYAYHLHEQKILKQTISGKDTKSLYFFSSSHIELEQKRSWSNVQKLQESQFPNIHIHQRQLDWKLFSPPPFKKYYQNTAIRFLKPTLVICNRYNSEWEGEPINYINVETLQKLFEIFHKNYQIVYVNQIFFGSAYEDDAKPMHLNEMSIVSDFCGDVITLLDLIKLYPNSSINELQCRIYSGCERFISSNGGFGILCSYFGGENIIFSKLCRELDPSVNSFYGWYSRFSKATISLAKKESDLIDICKRKWIDHAPLFNIIIRTSGRPNYFHDCLKSIYNQSYKNVNIIVGVDDEKNLDYVQGHACTIVSLEKHTTEPQLPPRKSAEYGVWFPYNNYLNKLLEYARVGYVIYLDDDDCFASDDSLSELASKIFETKAELIFWRVLFPDGLIVPSDINWEKRTPVNRDMSGIGFCHTTDVIPTWEPWKRGDYRIAKYLTENTKKEYWFDRIITTTQREKAGGYGLKDDKAFIQWSPNPPLMIVITAFEDHDYLEECLDSIVNQAIPEKCPHIRVLVAVDRCIKNRKLTRKYAPHVEFYFHPKNYGKYMMKNSLLLKIWRRDSLVLFFDPDDIMPPGFLNSYYLRFQDLQIQNINGNLTPGQSDIILYTRCICVSHDLIEKAKHYQNLPFTECIGKLQSILGDLTDEFIHICIALMKNSAPPSSECNIVEILENYITLYSFLSKNSPHNLVRKSARPDGVFFTQYSTLERLGFFFTSGEYLDSDLFLRAKAMKINSYSENCLPYFIKQISPSSLVNLPNEDNNEYTKKVQKEIQKRLADEKYVANKKALTLKLLT
jgi:glycosyltransferase involved in cell wall biosynthesis